MIQPLPKPFDLTRFFCCLFSFHLHKVSAVIKIRCHIADIHDNVIAGQPAVSIGDHRITGLLGILDESATVEILNKVLAFQHILKEQGIHMVRFLLQVVVMKHEKPC